MFSTFITSTKLNTFKLILTCSKNVKQQKQKVSNFRNVHACMNTLSIESLFRPVAGLISMPWLHGIKTRHDINGKKSPII